MDLESASLFHISQELRRRYDWSETIVLRAEEGRGEFERRTVKVSLSASGGGREHKFETVDEFSVHDDIFSI